MTTELRYDGSRLAAPAVRVYGGSVFAGMSYAEIRETVLAKASEYGMGKDASAAMLASAEEGFVTERGDFVNRGAALSIAVLCGQVEKGKTADANLLTPGDPVEYAAFKKGGGE